MVKKSIIFCTIVTLYGLGNTISSSIPFFKKNPMLKYKLPHIKLATLPTPIKRLVKLGTEKNIPYLFLKSDAHCAIPFGGNKVRKLEFLLADAKAHGMKHIVTVGGAGSNHATATAAHAQNIGLKCTVLLEAQKHTSSARRNLLLMQKFGAIIKYFPEQKEYVQQVNFYEKRHLIDHYFIPSGGSTSLGTLGYVNAAFELKKQIEQGAAPAPDYIYVPLGSAGTAVGLSIGLQLAGLETKVVAVCISKIKSERIAKFMKLFEETKNLLHDQKILTQKITTRHVVFNDHFAHLDYAQHDPKVTACIEALYKHEQIKLESTYSGKAFAAMLHDIKKESLQSKKILFWNTFCSGELNAKAPDKTAYKTLPKELHSYFESPLSPLDQGY